MSIWDEERRQEEDEIRQLNESNNESTKPAYRPVGGNSIKQSEPLDTEDLNVKEEPYKVETQVKTSGFAKWALVVGGGLLGLYALVVVLSRSLDESIEADYYYEDSKEVIQSYEEDEYGEDLSADDYNYLALSYLDEDRYQEGYDTLMEGLDEHADMDDELLMAYYNNLCWALNGLSRYEEAKEYGELAINLGDTSSYIYTNYGNALLSLYEYEAAIDIYMRAVNGAEGYENFLYSNIGECYYQLEDYHEAAEWFDKYYELYPHEVMASYDLGWAKAMDTGDYKSGYSDINRMIQVVEDDPNVTEATAVYLKAEYLIEFGEYKKATVFLEKYFTNFMIENPDIANQLVMAYVYNGDYEKAVDFGWDMIGHDVFYVDMYYYMLDAYYNVDNDKDALSLLEHYEAGMYETYEEYMELSYLYSYNFFYDKSDEVLEELVLGDLGLQGANSLEMDQYQWEDALFEWTYVLSELDDYDRLLSVGLEFIDEVATINMPNVVADAYFELGEYDKALEYYDLAIANDPEYSYMYENAIVTHYINGDYVNALDYLEEAYTKGLDDETYEYYKEFIVYSLKEKPGVQVFDYIRENYMYFEDSDAFSALEKELIGKDSLTTADFKEIEAVTFAEDEFSYFIYPDEFEAYLEYEEMVSSDYYFIDDNTLYLRIDFFSTLTDTEVLRIFEMVKEPSETTLIVDLRTNYGGDTDSAYNILDYLLPNAYLGDWDSPLGDYYAYYSDGRQYDFKEIFVYTDDETISSAEIVTLGLKEFGAKFNKEVTVIGETTFGKGVGQIGVAQMNQLWGLFVVNAYWSVAEVNINGVGIEPDVLLIDGTTEEYLELSGVSVDEL